MKQDIIFKGWTGTKSMRIIASIDWSVLRPRTRPARDWILTFRLSRGNLLHLCPNYRQRTTILMVQQFWRCRVFFSSTSTRARVVSSAPVLGQSLPGRAMRRQQSEWVSSLQRDAKVNQSDCLMDRAWTQANGHYLKVCPIWQCHNSKATRESFNRFSPISNWWDRMRLIWAFKC